MTAYQISAPMHGETTLEGFGLVPFDFDAGVVTPADEKEAAVLARLLENGAVELAVSKPKAKTAKSETTEDKE